MQRLKKLASLSFIFLFANCLAALANSNSSMGFNYIVPNATIVRSENYKVLGNSEGETSTFFFFGLFPVTNPLNIEYAISQAVQKIPEGDSMVNMIVWKETHNIFPLGSISVLKVKGDVVSFKVETPLFEDDKKGKKTK